MHLRVKLYSTLCHHASDAQPAHPIDIEVSEEANLQDLMLILKIPPEEAQITFVNGVLQSMDWRLKEGDLVGLLPAMGGG
jgi:molybdopterin converting factor small subunit